jgi:hypothetical protein
MHSTWGCLYKRWIKSLFLEALKESGSPDSLSKLSHIPTTERERGEREVVRVVENSTQHGNGGWIAFEFGRNGVLEGAISDHSHDMTRRLLAHFIELSAVAHLHGSDRESPRNLISVEEPLETLSVGRVVEAMTRFEHFIIEAFPTVLHWRGAHVPPESVRGYMEHEFVACIDSS